MKKLMMSEAHNWSRRGEGYKRFIRKADFHRMDHDLIRRCKGCSQKFYPDQLVDELCKYCLNGNGSATCLK